ncbi:MAG: hypothetical protein AB4062_11540 [Crocosphaera sp.]
MDPISLILSALVAGGAKTAGNVCQDTYDGLKAVIKRKFENQGKSNALTILDTYQQQPQETKALLKDELTEVGADKDQEIIQLAHKLMKQLNSQSADSNVTINTKNVGIGQMYGGNVTQTFS